MFETDDREEDPNTSESGITHAPFVGRKEVKVQIKEDIKKKHFQLFQITGGAVVGKSRLAEVISDELSKESLDYKTHLKCISISLRNKNAQCLQLIKKKILDEFGKEDHSRNGFDFLDDLKETLKIANRTGKKYFIIVMDDCDRMISDDSRTVFITLVSTLVKSCRRVNVILTSREKFDFPRLGDAARHYRLSALANGECVELLTRYAPNVQFSQDEPLIIKHCSGLPLLLLILARTLEEHKSMLTKEDFLEVLEKFPLDGWNINRVSDEDSIEKIMEQFIACLDDYLKQNLSVLAYFPGSFSAEAGAAVSGVSRESEAKVFTLIPLHKKSMVEFDTTKSRYSISPVIRQYVNSRLLHLRDSDTVRLRFCKYYSTILCAANTNLYEKPTNSVVSLIYDEWANVEQALREASQPTSDLFHINMKIVRQAPEVITALVPELAEAYYRRCKNAAELFGTDFDVACIQSCLGASLGYVNGGQLKSALNILLETEKKIPADSGYQRVKLYSHIEWNLYRQGKIEEAMRYQDLGLAVEPSGADKTRIQRIQVNIHNHKALALVLQGRLDDSLKLLEETIDSTKKTFKNHPAVKVMLNSLGLVFSEKKDDDTALKYFMASLTERRKSAGREKRYLIPTLVNAGGLLMKRNKGALALQLLDEAVEIRRKLEWIHLDTAVALYNRGKILMACGRYEEALADLKDALDVYKECVDTHWVLAGVRVEIAKCLDSIGQSGEAEQILKEVLTDRMHLQQNKQLNIYILEAFDQLMKLTSDRQEEWRLLATEKCTYYESLIQDENPRDTADKVQYEEDLKSLRETIEGKMDNLKSSASFTLESDVAVYKLLKAKGQPQNQNCKSSDIKSPMKGKDTSILRDKSSKGPIADQVVEGTDHTIGGVLENKTNNKITNVNMPICCDRKLSGGVPGIDSEIKTSSECNCNLPSTVLCSSNQLLTQPANTRSASGQIIDTQLLVSNPGTFVGERQSQGSNAKNVSQRDLINEEHCLTKKLKENPCNNNDKSNKCSDPFELAGKDRNSTEIHRSSANERAKDRSLTNCSPNFPRDCAETAHNCDEKTGSPNLQNGDFPEAMKSKVTGVNKYNGNMHKIKRDSSCLPVNSLKLDDCTVVDHFDSECLPVDFSKLDDCYVVDDSECLPVDPRKLVDCSVDRYDSECLPLDYSNLDDCSVVDQYDSACLPVDSLNKLDDCNVVDQFDSACHPVDSRLSECNFVDHFDSDTSTITGSSISSVETIRNFNLDKMPD